MNYVDFLLFPVYVLIFWLYFRYCRKKIQDPILKKYHRSFFWVKTAATLAFALVNVYVLDSDSFHLYYPEGNNLYHLILNNFSNIHFFFSEGKNFDTNLVSNPKNAGYFVNEGNFLLIKFVAFLSFFSFGKYLITSLFFSFLSFIGVWKLFRFFYYLYPHLYKPLSVAILFLPSFVFWSSGPAKEALSVASIGWISYGLFFLFNSKKNKIVNLCCFLFFSYVLFTVKSYIFLSYLPFFILFLILFKRSFFRSRFKKLAISFLLIFAGLTISLILIDNTSETKIGGFALNSFFDRLQFQKKSFEAMSDIAESSFSLYSTFDGTFTSFIQAAPEAIGTTFFRPFIWESKKISTLLSSLESLGILLFSLWVLFKTGIFYIFSSLKSPAILYCTLFSLVFALFVGITTLNFGTLVRYKIPCLPFYLIAFILMLDYKKVRQAEGKSNKNLIGVT